MALRVKAVERLLKFTNDPKDPGVYRYVIKPEMYSTLTQAKVIKEAALRSGVSQGDDNLCAAMQYLESIYIHPENQGCKCINWMSNLAIHFVTMLLVWFPLAYMQFF